MANFQEFEKDPKVILQKIESLRAQGYDRIHIPGGTSKDGSFYAGAFLCHYDRETKQFFFVGLPYNSSFYKTEDEKNGHTKRQGETPEECAVRETIEESGLQIKKEDLIVALEFSVNDRVRIGQKHWKHFYYTEVFSGNLFTFDGPNPIDGETAAPIMIPASLLVEVLFPGHLSAFLNVVEKLCSKSLEYMDSLMSSYEQLKVKIQQFRKPK